MIAAADEHMTTDQLLAGSHCIMLSGYVASGKLLVHVSVCNFHLYQQFRSGRPSESGSLGFSRFLNLGNL